MTGEDAILALLERRDAGQTICPSEAARLIAGPDGDWRLQMPAVHEAVDRLAAQGTIALSWQGAAMQERRGPYRIARR